MNIIVLHFYFSILLYFAIFGHYFYFLLIFIYFLFFCLIILFVVNKNIVPKYLLFFFIYLFIYLFFIYLIFSDYKIIKRKKLRLTSHLSMKKLTAWADERTKVLMVVRACCITVDLPKMDPSGDVMCWYTLLINSSVRRLSF